MPDCAHRPAKAPSRWWLAAAGAAVAAAAGLVAWRRHEALPDTANLPVARHEEQDIGFRPLAVAAGLTLLGLASMAGLALWIYPDTPTDKSLPNPMPTFPQPVLQTNVGADYATLHSRQLQQLNGAYWLDQAHGTVHLPIDQAMAAVAREGIPDWPTARERRK